MADIMGMDELETFVLDFLAYRREQKMRVQSPKNHMPKLIEHKPEADAGIIRERDAATEAGHIPPAIGMGWPYYKGANTRRTGLESRKSMAQSQNRTAYVPSSQNDIIPALTPVVAQALARFGPPTSPKAMEHLVNQVIASAMQLPPVSESIQASEIAPWGRMALLQAVVELLIRSL